jgi:hypothetical protein
MGMATLIYLHTSHSIPLSVVPINMQSGISSFVMLSRSSSWRVM